MPSPTSCSSTSSCAPTSRIVDTLHQDLRARHGVPQRLRPRDLLLRRRREPSASSRAPAVCTSFMDNPNANANVIALTLPLLLYLWFARKWRRVYVLGSLAILAYALVATSSVGGLLWSLAGVAVFMALTINWRVVVGVTVCIAVAIPLLEKYGSTVLPETFQVRVLERHAERRYGERRHLQLPHGPDSRSPGRGRGPAAVRYRRRSVSRPRASWATPVARRLSAALGRGRPARADRLADAAADHRAHGALGVRAPGRANESRPRRWR